jgi:hypothetical protein
VLYVLTRQSQAPTVVTPAQDRGRPALVYLTLGGQLLVGLALAFPTIRALCRRRPRNPTQLA